MHFFTNCVLASGALNPDNRIDCIFKPTVATQGCNTNSFIIFSIFKLLTKWSDNLEFNKFCKREATTSFGNLSIIIVYGGLNRLYIFIPSCWIFHFTPLFQFYTAQYLYFQMP